MPHFIHTHHVHKTDRIHLPSHQRLATEMYEDYNKYEICGL